MSESLCWLLAAILAAGCATKDVDSESHSLCSGDQDCTRDVRGAVCIAGKCQSVEAGPDSATSSAAGGARAEGGRASGTGGRSSVDGSNGSGGSGAGGTAPVGPDASESDGATEAGGNPACVATACPSCSIAAPFPCCKADRQCGCTYAPGAICL